MGASSMPVIHSSSGTTSLNSDGHIRDIANGTSVDIANWVRDTASAHGILVRLRPSDRFARTVSRLSDAVTDLDGVEELLLALSRAKVITPFQRGLLHANYLR